MQAYFKSVNLLYLPRVLIILTTTVYIYIYIKSYSVRCPNHDGCCNSLYSYSLKHQHKAYMVSTEILSSTIVINCKSNNTNLLK